MPAQEDFKQQVREIFGDADARVCDTVAELWIALDQEKPCDRQDSIEFMMQAGNLIPSYRKILSDRYEEYDGFLMLPAEIERAEQEIEHARNYD